VTLELQTFTTLYNVHQDRLCIDGQTCSGEVVSLWFTYRLLRKLLPSLLQLITPVAETEDKSNILAEWALTTAQAHHKPEMAVRIPPAQNTQRTNAPLPASWLIRSIELKSSPKRALLVFCISDHKAVANVSLNPEHLRLWLGIVYRLWKRAGWSENEWPNWMSAAEMSSTSTNVVLQ